MDSVVCTLFEGNYHFGVAALTNSLYKNGFRGNIYAGYRGNLPKWANKAYENNICGWGNAKTLNVAIGLQLNFVLLETKYHLTNYKPDFMLKLLNGPAQGTNAIFYFDPDIVLNAPWSFIEEWVSCGVALCEDVNSPLPNFHPRRMAWRSKLKSYNINLHFKESQYVNGGFIGVNFNDFEFIDIWKNIQETMSMFIGGLTKSSLEGESLAIEHSGPFAPFSKTDQDALNCTIEAYNSTCSIIGKEAMGFVAGVSYLPHALGNPKPWNWNFLSNSIKGFPPTYSIKAYWVNTNTYIKCYSSGKLMQKKDFAIPSLIY